VDVYTTSIDGSLDSDVPHGKPVYMDGVQVRYFRAGIGRRLFRAPGLSRALDSQIKDYDIVHTHSLFLWPPAVAARTAHRAGVPYVVSPRGMLVRELVEKKSRHVKEFWLRFVDRPNLENAAAIHYTSWIELDEAAAFGYRTPWSLVVPNGIDAPLPEVEPDSVSGRVTDILGKGPLITHVGRVHWKKGIDVVLRALPDLPGVHFAVAGNDDEGIGPGLRALANGLSVADRVHWLGPVDENDKFALLRGSDLFVLMSISENFGNAALEAAAVGCPVVLSPDVGVGDALVAAGAGRFVPRDPEALSSALGELLAAPETLSSMAQAGKTVCTEHFSWSAVAARVEEGYRELLRQRGML